MSSASAQPPVPESVSPSEAARTFNVFIAPSRTFTDLRRSAAWWAPFLLLAIGSLLFVYVVDQKIGFRKVAENQMQMSPRQAARLEQMPAEQRAQAMAQQAKGIRYFSYGYPGVILLWNLIISAILFATFKFAASADVKFKAAYAVVMYASLPLLLKTLLATLAVAAGASADSFTFQNPAATNPGYFLNPADSHWLYSVASALDIFMIWTLVLTAIGFTCISKLKRGTAFLGVFAWYVVFVAAGAALGAAFS